MALTFEIVSNIVKMLNCDNDIKPACLSDEVKSGNLKVSEVKELEYVGAI